MRLCFGAVLDRLKKRLSSAAAGEPFPDLGVDDVVRGGNHPLGIEANTSRLFANGVSMSTLSRFEAEVRYGDDRYILLKHDLGGIRDEPEDRYCKVSL